MLQIESSVAVFALDANVYNIFSFYHIAFICMSVYPWLKHLYVTN
jgi:hypothetical protein